MGGKGNIKEESSRLRRRVAGQHQPEESGRARDSADLGCRPPPRHRTTGGGRGESNGRPNATKGHQKLIAGIQTYLRMETSWKGIEDKEGEREVDFGGKVV